MPVSEQTPEIAYTGNGVTTVFAFPFLIFSATDLTVRVDGALGVLNVDYTVSGVGVESGGNVTFLTAPSSGAYVALQRRVPLSRDIEYQYSGDFQSPTVNRDFDRLWMGVQDINQDGVRALRLPVGDTASTLLPPLDDRALRGLAFDSNGNAVPAASSDASSLAVMLQDSNTDDNGAALVGFDPSNNYPNDTLGKAVSDIDDTVNKIGDDTSAANGTALVGYKVNSANAVGRPLNERLAERISVKDFGAVGDGVADDTLACQRCINYVVSVGGTVFFPPGNYKITGSGLLVDQTAITNPILRHVKIVGAGAGNSQINYTGTGVALSYLGAQPNALNSYFSIESMRIMGVSQTQATGLNLQLASGLTLRDVTVQLFADGIVARDVLQSSFENITLGANSRGITMDKNVFSPPNAINFLNAQIVSNLEYGAFLKDSATVQFVGGAIQGNGIGGVGTDRFGIQLNNFGALAGAVAANFEGVYFEHNATLCDLWLVMGGGSGNASSVVVKGCTFNRITNNALEYVLNNIRADISSPNKTQLTMLGNGFVGYNTYVANAARRYVLINPGGGAVYDVVDLGNVYSSDVEKPAFIGPVKSWAGMASAWVTFDGTLASPVAIRGYNVSGITKNSTGDYTITFGKQGPVSNYPVQINMNGVGFPVIFSPGAANVRIQTKNNAAAAADFALISVVCYGNGELL